MKTEYHGLECVISGGQTGADQAGLVAARTFNLPTGGVCPLNWETSAGSNRLLEGFGLVARGSYKSRTIENIKLSDMTLIFTVNHQSAGSVLTIEECIRYEKPYVHIKLNEMELIDLKSTLDQIIDMIKRMEVRVLNIAGNREKPNQKIFDPTKMFVHGLLVRLDLERLLNSPF